MPVPNLNGQWGGFAEIRRIVGSTYHGIHVGLQTGLTMKIIQQPLANSASVQVRSGYFGRVCSDSTRSLSPFVNHPNNPDIPVCPGYVDIPLALPCRISAPHADPFFGTNVGLYNPPSGSFPHSGEPYHMGFETHGCEHDPEAGYADPGDRLMHRRRWAVWLASAGPANMPYLEVRCEWLRKPGYEDGYWFFSAVLEPYHEW